jgi:hypothetical protein
MIVKSIFHRVNERLRLQKSPGHCHGHNEVMVDFVADRSFHPVIGISGSDTSNQKISSTETLFRSTNGIGDLRREYSNPPGNHLE